MNLLKSLAAVSSITMLSRILGFVRDTLIARTFGAGMATDAFFIAFKLPNLLRRIFAEGAFTAAFVPTYSKVLASEGQEAADKLTLGDFPDDHDTFQERTRYSEQQTHACLVDRRRFVQTDPRLVSVRF